MKLAHPRFWLGLLAAIAVTSFVGRDLFRTAPGPLSASHAGVAKLVGMGSCRHCHGGWFGDMTGSCTSCHEPIRTQVAEGRGLHGTLAPELAARCGSCHGEHHGESFAIVNRASFAAAGVPDPARFDHAKVGYEMAGKHLELACTKCHVHAEVPVLTAGQSRFLGLDRDCSSCHADPHEGRMARSCASCHGQVDFHLLEPLGHERALPLTDRHGSLQCQACHTPGTRHALENLGADAVGSQPRLCGDCHASPHATEFLTNVARRDQRPVAATCAACHDAKSPFTSANEGATADRHAASGFALTKPHTEVACASCHGTERGAFAARYPGRAPDSCQACHQDVHAGEFAGRPLAANGCVDCHERTHFAPPRFDATSHARTAFALTGRHAQTECRSCHRPHAPGVPAKFVGTSTSCAACHADAHDGFFTARIGAAPPGGKGRAPNLGGCAECHDTQSFAKLPQAFAHGDRTGFPLRDAHAEAECGACHRARDTADRTGRRFGTVAETFGTVTGCATCHADPHGGIFERAGLPREVLGKTGCARCHLENSFRAMERFDHGSWTGFTLLGAHRRTECSACHVGDRGARSAFPAARGTRCAQCHEDAHGGQFLRNGAPTDCARCHLTGETFRELAFDHDLHSRFALGSQHAKVACSACHKPYEADGKQLVRYRPLPVLCVDCHGQPNSPFRVRKESGR